MPRPLRSLATALAFVAFGCSGCGGGADPSSPGTPEDTLRAAPPSTTSTVTGATLTVTMLDLGPLAEGGGGDALLVADSGGARPWHALLDAGDGPDALEALRAAGVDSLDLLVVSHAHFDHYGGAEPLLEGVHVARVVHNGQRRTNVTWQRFLSEARARAGRVDTLTTREVVEPGPGRARLVLLPPLTTWIGTDTSVGQELNDGSLAVRLELGAFSLLFTGDAELLANERFVALYPGDIDADVLEVGHHGSADATQAAWLAAVSPRAALVSANGTTHPHGRTLGLLEGVVGLELFCTPDHGRVVLRVAPDGRWSTTTAFDARRRCRVGRNAF